MSWNLLESNPLDPEFVVMSSLVFMIPIQSQNKLVATSISTAGKDDYIRVYFIMNV